MFINKEAIIISTTLKCGYYIKNADTKNPENKTIYQKARYQDNCEKVNIKNGGTKKILPYKSNIRK